MNALPEGDEERLLRRMVEGSEEAFTNFYRQRSGAVYRFALQMTGDAGIAEDVAQETFLTVIRDCRRFDRSRGTAVSWLFGIARNHVLRRLEQDSRYAAVAGDDLEAEAFQAAERPAEGDVLELLTRGESLEALRQAVLNLPAHYREAVVLCDLQEMSYDQAAQVLHCAIGTVRSRLHRGRALLLERMRLREACLP